MNKTILKKISIVAVIASIITPLFSCHPDGPEDFIDYVYDAGNMGGGNQNTNTNDWSYPTSRPQQPWSGRGSSYDPYIIKTAQDLANLAYMVNDYGYSYENTYFKLDRSIDLNYGISVNAYSSNAKEWTSIGNTYNQFKGNFDGNSYTIDGLYKNSLFGYIYNGSVKNLTMETGYIYTNSNYTGSIASYIYNTTIYNCTNNGTAISSSSYGGYVGGLVGEMENSKISSSYNHVNISSTNGAAGGIVGYMSDSSSISYSYNYATVSSSSYGYAGGIAGKMYNSSISYSYNYYGISSTYGTAGGIVGYADYNSSCSGCYNSGYVSGSTQGDIIGNRGNTDNKDEGNNENKNDWSYPTEYPNQLWSGSGTSYDPYIIKTAQDLANLSYMVNDYGYSYYDTYFRLDNNIDLNYGISVNEYSSDAKEWTSIGNSSYPFKGNFDGNNYTIDGLYNGSLFGYISEGSVKNLTMETGYIYSYSYNVGSIASYIYNTTISNCTNNGTIVSSSYGHSGGLVGQMESSEISSSDNYANVSSSYYYAGGIAGYAEDDNSYCSGCHNYGTVSGYYTKSDIVGNWENTENKDENDWSYPAEYPNQLWSGSGSSYDPYIIKTAQDLANLAYMINNSYNSYENTYFSLANNIDLNYGISVNEYSSSAKQWCGIGNYYNPFKGNFDGNGYTIDGLYDGSLFFYISDGSVANLTMGTGYITGFYIENDFYGGPIASYILNTTISNCTNNGTIVSMSSGYSGGLVGKMENSEISNSSNYADVTSPYGYAGGIVGYADYNSSYSECYNYGNVLGNTTGEIAGNENDWTYPTDQPKRLWSGSGSYYDPYIIKTAQDLANLAYMVNNSNNYEYTYFKLDRSIDLNYGISVIDYSSAAKQWISIGIDCQFKGNFDGNGCTINGLYKDSLFVSIYGGSVKNLTMGTGYIIYDNSNIAGTIARHIYNTTISNCINNGTIVSSSDGHSGGLVGQMESSEISNSSNYANVSSTNGAAGGIVGYMSDSSSISYSYNYATVSSSSYGYAGGIAGKMYNSSISYSYNYYGISSTYGTAGGIVGYADYNSSCSGCYNSGYVSGSTQGDIIGNK